MAFALASLNPVFQKQVLDLISACHRPQANLDLSILNLAWAPAPSWAYLKVGSAQPDNNFIYLMPIAVAKWGQPDWSPTSRIYDRVGELAMRLNIFWGGQWVDHNNGAGNPVYFAGAGSLTAAGADTPRRLQR